MIANPRASGPGALATSAARAARRACRRGRRRERPRATGVITPRSHTPTAGVVARGAATRLPRGAVPHATKMMSRMSEIVRGFLRSPSDARIVLEKRTHERIRNTRAGGAMGDVKRSALHRHLLAMQSCDDVSDRSKPMRDAISSHVGHTDQIHALREKDGVNTLCAPNSQYRDASSSRAL